MNQKLKKPSIFLYSIIFPAIQYLAGFTLYVIGENPGLGYIERSIIYIISILSISWFMATQHKRHFTNDERWNLIIYCLMWITLSDMLSIIALTYYPELLPSGSNVPPDQFISSFIINLFINLILLWVGFKILATAVINLSLNESD